VKLLMHTCCAPCSVMCIETLKKENIEPILYWYNPNIHPFKEYKMRKNTLIKHAEDIGVKLILNDQYGLRKFIESIFPDFDNRCINRQTQKFQ